MRLHKAFVRVKPAAAGAVTLGADAAPSAPPGAETPTGNFAKLLLYDAHGNPLQGVTVGIHYVGGGPAPSSITGALWVFDETTGVWFRVTGASEAFGLERLVSYALAAGGFRGSGGGDLAVALVPTDAGYADGAYTFALGADYVARSAVAAGGGGGGAVGTQDVNLVGRAVSTAHVTSPAYEETRVLKAAAGRLFALAVGNKDSADRYLCLFDKAAAPAPGDAFAFPPTLVPAGGTVVLGAEDGLVFATGIACALSTSQAAYAAPGTSPMFVRGEFL